MLGVLTTAAHHHRQLRLRYRANPEHVTERTIDPYGLVAHQGQWYMVAYCHLRHGIRIFRLDRMEHAQLLDTHFTYPTGFDSRTYFVHSVATLPIHRPSELREAFQTLASELWAIAGSAIISAEPLTPPYD